MASERSISSITQDTVDQTVGLSWSGTRQLLLRTPPNHVDVDELIAAWSDRYEAMAEIELRLKPGVVELVEVLELLDIDRAVATGSYRALAICHLASYKLELRFDTIVAKEDCLNGKPTPDPFLITAQRLGIEPANCWALDDSRNGIRSAHDAGMQTIMVPDLVSPDEETAALCCHIASSLGDVVSLIEDRRTIWV